MKSTHPPVGGPARDGPARDGPAPDGSAQGDPPKVGNGSVGFGRIWSRYIVDFATPIRAHVFVLKTLTRYLVS